MASMYETIMSLPLLKGLSEEQVSAFLEKTNIQFLNYKAADTILKDGQEAEMLRFVISGKVRIHRHICREPQIEVHYTLPEKHPLFPDHIFGFFTESPAQVDALTDTSIMQFPKIQYLSLLQTNEIFLLNYLNYLSLGSQRSADVLVAYPGNSFEEWLGRVIATFTPRHAESIDIVCQRESLRKICNSSAARTEAAISALRNLSLLRTTRKGISVADRDALLDTIRDIAQKH